MIAREIRMIPMLWGVMLKLPIRISFSGNMLGNSWGLVPQITMPVFRRT